MDPCNRTQAIIQAQYVGTIYLFHTSGSYDSLVIAMKTKPRKMLLYIPQNNVLTEVYKYTMMSQSNTTNFTMFIIVLGQHVLKHAALVQ